MKRTGALLGLFLIAGPAFAVGSLADVAVYDRVSGTILPVYSADGRWYVAGRPGNEYELRIRNNSNAMCWLSFPSTASTSWAARPPRPIKAATWLGPGSRCKSKAGAKAWRGSPTSTLPTTPTRTPPGLAGPTMWV